MRVGKNMFVMTFCVTRCFQRRSHVKRKNIVNKYIKLLLLDGLLYSAFVISPWKKAPTSHFFCSQHVENGREKNYVLWVYSFRNYILTFKDRGTCRYLPICSHLLKKSFMENYYPDDNETFLSCENLKGVDALCASEK